MKISRKKQSKKFSVIKNKNNKNLELELLEKLQLQMSLSVDSFLILSEEGSPTQIALAHQKARSDFSQFGPKMSRIAERVGGELPSVVEEFLASIEIILHEKGALDEDLITHCLNSAAKLKAELKAPRRAS